MSTSSNFPNRVIALRERLGISQTELAERLHISRNYVSMIEGGREPSDTLKALITRMEAEVAAPSFSLREGEGTAAFSLRDEPMPPSLKTAQGLKQELHRQSQKLLLADIEQSLLISATMRRALDMLDKKLEEPS